MANKVQFNLKYRSVMYGANLYAYLVKTTGKASESPVLTGEEHVSEKKPLPTDMHFPKDCTKTSAERPKELRQNKKALFS